MCGRMATNKRGRKDLSLLNDQCIIKCDILPYILAFIFIRGNNRERLARIRRKREELIWRERLFVELVFVSFSCWKYNAERAYISTIYHGNYDSGTAIILCSCTSEPPAFSPRIYISLSLSLSHPCAGCALYMWRSQLAIHKSVTRIQVSPFDCGPIFAIPTLSLGRTPGTYPQTD